MNDPAYSEKSIREMIEDHVKNGEGPIWGPSLLMVASAIDELRGIVEHLDERLAAVEKLVDPGPRQAERGADIAE